VKISKTYTFDAAHQLVGHEGKCKNLHGHTYSVTVEIEGEQIHNPGASDDTMVMDYGNLDIIVKPVIEQLDHAFLYGDADVGAEGLSSVYVYVNQLDLKRCYVGKRSTAEEICYYIWGILAIGIPSSTRLTVNVSETPKTSASYEALVGGKILKTEPPLLWKYYGDPK